MVRVVNPDSPYFGATGHIIGRSERGGQSWLVRFAGLGVSVLLQAEELAVVARTVRE